MGNSDAVHHDDCQNLCSGGPPSAGLCHELAGWAFFEVAESAGCGGSVERKYLKFPLQLKLHGVSRSHMIAYRHHYRRFGRPTLLFSSLVTGPESNDFLTVEAFLSSFLHSLSGIPRSSRYLSRAARSLHSEYGSHVVSPRFHWTKNDTLFLFHWWASISSTNHSLSSASPKS